jgi:ATP-dependent Zn protease
MKKNKGLGMSSLLATLAIVVIGIILVYTQISKNKEDKTLAYTDLIKQIAEKNISKVEMTTGSTSITVILKREIWCLLVEESYKHQTCFFWELCGRFSQYQIRKL